MKKILGTVLLALVFSVVSVSGAVTDEDLRDDIKRYWAFDSGTGTTIIDSVGNQNGTATSSNIWDSNSLLGDFALNPNGNYYVDTDTQLDNTNWVFISCWAFLDRSSYSSGDAKRPFGLRGTGGDSQDALAPYYVYDDNQWKLAAYNSYGILSSQDHTHTDNAWNFVAVQIKENEEVQMWINDVKKSTSVGSLGDYNKDLYIGTANFPDADTREWYDQIDECTYYESSTKISDEKILEIYDRQSQNLTGAQYPFTSSNPQLSFQNITANNQNFTNNSFWNTTTLDFDTFVNATDTNNQLNQTYRLYNASGDLMSSSQYATNNENGSFTLNLQEQTYNISFEAENNETNTSTGNYTFTIDLTPPTINLLNTSERNDYVVDWSTIFNISDASNCEVTVENSTTSCSGNYTFIENGDQSVSIFVNDSAGNSATENFTILINPVQTFEFEDFQGNQLTNFTFGGDQYQDKAEIELFDLGYGNQTLQFEKLGYQTTNVSFDLNTTSDINRTVSIGISLLYLEIRDSDSNNILTRNVDIELIGDDFAGVFSTSNGSITIENITNIPGQYQLNLEADGYEELTYYFQHTGLSEVNLTLFMQNETNTIPVKTIVRDGFGNRMGSDQDNYPSCIVKINEYDISSNSYVLQTMGETNSNGEVIFNLDTENKVYKPVVECPEPFGTTIFKGQKITTTPLDLEIGDSNLEIFPSIPSISSQPISFDRLDNTTGRFTFAYTDDNNILSQGCLNVTLVSYTSESPVKLQCLNSSTGQISVDFNLSPGQTYRADGFVKTNGETFQLDSFVKRISQTDFDWGLLGVFFGLLIVGALAIIGVLMAGAQGALVGATAGLWIAGLPGIWDFNYLYLGGWSILLIIGLIFAR